MAPRKRIAQQDGPQGGVVAQETTTKSPALPVSKIPAPIRFPLLVLLNMSMSTLLYTISAEFTAGDLANVSRTVNAWPEIFGLVACKIVELGISWFSGFDGYDVAALALLSHLPPLVLLTTCYSIRPTTMLSCLAVDLLAMSIPFNLLRRISPAHADDAPQGSIANRSIVSDLPTQAFASLLGAGVYAFVVFGSYYTWLPAHLVLNFDGLRSMAGIYNVQFPILVILFIPVGIAAKVFLFTPSTAAKKDFADAQRESFDAETATLEETFWYNIWGFSNHTRVMISRSAILAGVTFLYSWVQVYASIEGAESLGAAGWAGVWAIAATLTGTAYSWVTNIEGVSS